MQILETLLKILQIFIAAANVGALLYAFKLFLRKPQTSIEERVAVLEAKVKEHDQSLHKGNERFQHNEKAIEVMIHSIMALIEFEVQYCITEKKPMSEELKEAKDDLHSFLARRGD